MDSQDQSESWVKNAQLDSYTFNPELNTGQFVILIDYYYADQFLNSQINGMAFVATLEYPTGLELMMLRN